MRNITCLFQILICLSFFTLLGCKSPSTREVSRTVASDDGPAVPKTGFYKITPYDAQGALDPTATDAIFGKNLFIHGELYLEKDGAETFMGLRGVFDIHGTVSSSQPDDGPVIHHWSLQKNEAPQGTLRILRENGELNLYFTFPPNFNVEKKLHLTYLGPKLTRFKNNTYLARHGSPFNRGNNNNGLYAANTIPALEESIRTGYDGFEIDVQMTKDKKFLAFHDAGLALDTDCVGRVKNWYLHDLEKCTMDHSTEVPGLIGKKAKLKAPLKGLKEMLEYFLPNPDLRVVGIDVKPASDDDIVEAMKDAFQNIKDEEQLKKVFFITRTDSSLVRLRKLFPTIPGALEGSIGREPPSKLSEFMPGRASIDAGNHSIVSFGMWIPIIQEIEATKVHTFVKLAHENGYKVMAWTAKHKPAVLEAMRAFPEFDILQSDTPFEFFAREQMLPKSRKKKYEEPEDD